MDWRRSSPICLAKSDVCSASYRYRICRTNKSSKRLSFVNTLISHWISTRTIGNCAFNCFRQTRNPRSNSALNVGRIALDHCQSTSSSSQPYSSENIFPFAPSHRFISAARTESNAIISLDSYMMTFDIPRTNTSELVSKAETTGLILTLTTSPTSHPSFPSSHFSRLLICNCKHHLKLFGDELWFWHRPGLSYCPVWCACSYMAL